MMTKHIEWDGKTIRKPGIYSKMPLELYHAANICDGPSISSSGLRKIFKESPAHFFAEWDGNPNRGEPKESRAFILGRAVHHLLLGQPFFAKLFCVQPEELPEEKGHKDAGEMKPWHGARSACKNWLKARAAENLTVLTQAEVTRIKGMAVALGMHPIVRNGALNGAVERSGFVKDKATGIWLKIRPDAIPTDSGDYVDLKITASVQWRDLQTAIFDYGYHQQMALIRSVARRLDLPFSSATLVFVEHQEPFCPRIVQVKDGDLDRGEKQNEHALATFARCLEAKRWPGPGGDREDAVYIELPEWAQKQIDDKIEFESV